MIKKQGRPPLKPLPLIAKPAYMYQYQIDFIMSQQGDGFAGRHRKVIDSAINAHCATEAIKYALKSGDAYGFLMEWIDGDFEYMKSVFPDVPESVYPQGGV